VDPQHQANPNKPSTGLAVFVFPSNPLPCVISVSVSRLPEILHCITYEYVQKLYSKRWSGAMNLLSATLTSPRFHPSMSQQGQDVTPHGFFCLTYSPSGALIVGGSVYGTFYGWDASSGNLLLGPIQAHLDDFIITHILFVTEDVFLSSAHDTTVRQWDARTGEPIGEAFTAHEGAVCRVASLPDKKTAASITKNGELLLWHLDTLEVIRKAHVSVDAFYALAFSPDGTRLVSVRWHVLRIYDVENCRLISEVNLEPHMPPMLMAAVFSPDASKVFFGSGSSSVVIWDVGKEEFENEVLVSDFDDILGETMCTPDGTLVAASTDHGKICVWSTTTRKLVTVLDDGGPFTFSSDSQCLTYVLHGTELSVNPLKNVKKVSFSFVISICC